MQLWPQDYIKLRELFPEGSHIPKYIVYQNVDRSSAITRALWLITDHPEYRDHYKKIFTTDDDGDEITDAEFIARAEVWVNEEWLNGSGIGILVNSGDNLGDAAPVPPSPTGISSEIRVNHGIPVEVDFSWKRLTLKTVSGHGLYSALLFFLYNVKKVDNLDWISRPPNGSLITNSVSYIEDLPKIKVTNQLRDDWKYSDLPEQNMPQAFPEVVIKLKRPEDTRYIPALNDAFYEDGEYWRIQCKLLLDEPYSWEFEGPPLYADLNLGTPTDPTEVPDFVYFHPNPSAEIGLRPRFWLSFSGEKKFIFGYNMETCRRKHFHDLSGNDIVSFQTSTLGWETIKNQSIKTYDQHNSYSSGWVDGSTGGNPNWDLINDDLYNLHLTGASALRVWAFERLEGIRFSFTDPGAGGVSLLDIQKQRADSGNHPNLKRKWYTITRRNGSIVRRFEYVCSLSEWENLKADLRIDTPAGKLNAILPPSRSPILRKLIDNAVELTRRAGAHGMRILWTLLTHYGESVPLNMYEFIPLVSEPGGPGRLPVEAWIYRDMLVDDDFRQSFRNNVLIHFVSEMEALNPNQGETIGYEVMNEVDIIWEFCQHSWSNEIKGRPGQETNWKLSQNQIRTFLNEFQNTIQSYFRESKIIISSVLGTKTSGDFPWSNYPSLVQSEMHLTNRISTRHSLETRRDIGPNLNLTANSMSRYTNQDGWTNHTIDLHTTPEIRDHGTCIFTEAGMINSGYDCALQESTFSWILGECVRKGYAGVFLWHYNDPERGQTRSQDQQNYGTDANALTEALSSPPNNHLHRDSPSRLILNDLIGFKNAYPRPVIKTIKEFVRRMGNNLLPQI